VSSEDGYRCAKDEEYLRAVVDSWKQDDSIASSQQQVETSPWIYHDERGTPLYGHIVRSIINKDGQRHPARPGILLFHTAAGPQDVFLFQKAAKLASSDLGCVVLICDIISDQDGWAWTPDGDRSRFNSVREELLRDNARVLRSRVKAAIQTLVGPGADDSNLGVDPMRIAGLGWCFGAQPILEMATLQHQQSVDGAGEDGDALTFSVSALVSYHGVYRRDPTFSEGNSVSNTKGTTDEIEREILICTGNNDPFVSAGDLEFAKATMGKQNFNVRIVEYDGAKHGFTNPAQDFNNNPAFQYDKDAAIKSWESTMELLERKL